jgi:hypothetical protein
MRFSPVSITLRDARWCMLQCGAYNLYIVLARDTPLSVRRPRWSTSHSGV